MSCHFHGQRQQIFGICLILHSICRIDRQITSVDSIILCFVRTFRLQTALIFSKRLLFSITQLRTERREILISIKNLSSQTVRLTVVKCKQILYEHQWVSHNVHHSTGNEFFLIFIIHPFFLSFIPFAPLSPSLHSPVFLSHPFNISIPSALLTLVVHIECNLLSQCSVLFSLHSSNMARLPNSPRRLQPF